MKSKAGFTLIEVGVVLAIIGVLAAISIPSVSYFLRQGRVKSVVGSINSIRNWIGTLQATGSVGGTLPVTEGGRPPTTGAGLEAAAAADVAAAARLDQVLLASGITDKLISFGMGSPVALSSGDGSDLVWSVRKRAFMIDDGGGQPSASESTSRDWSACSRLEARLATPAVLPSVAQGGNFRLDGSTNTSINTVVAYVHLVDVPYKDAVELAKAMNSEDMVNASGLGQEAGPVVYAAPSAAAATTDVYIFVAAI